MPSALDRRLLSREEPVDKPGTALDRRLSPGLYKSQKPAAPVMSESGDIELFAKKLLGISGLPAPVGKIITDVAMSQGIQSAVSPLGSGIQARVVKDVGAGLAGTAGTWGGNLRMLGAEELGRGITDLSTRIQKELIPPDQNFGDTVAQGFGSMAAFLIPGFGIMRGAGALARFGPRLAYWLGVGAGTVLEAASESGGVYNEIIGRGGTRDEAMKAGNRVFWSNLPLNAVLNRFGVFSEKSGVAYRALSSGIAEGLQEPSQQIISNLALHDPEIHGVLTARHVMEGTLTSMGVGMITGGTVGGVRGAVTKELPDGIVEDAGRPEVKQPAPPEPVQAPKTPPGPPPAPRPIEKAPMPEPVAQPAFVPAPVPVPVPVVPVEPVAVSVPLPTTPPEATAPVAATVKPKTYEVPGQELGDRDTLTELKKLVETGQFQAEPRDIEFLKKLETFWDNNPDAVNAVVQDDGNLRPVFAQEDAGDTSFDFSEESIGKTPSETPPVGLVAMTREDFTRRYPGVPEAVHKDAVRNALRGSSSISDEVVESYPDLAEEVRMEMESEENARSEKERLATPVLDAIRRGGGINAKSAKEYRGELAGVKSKNVIRKKGGLSIPQWAEKLSSEGLIDEYDENLLFEIMNKEASGIGFTGLIEENKEAYAQESAVAFGPTTMDPAAEAADRASQLSFDFDASKLPPSNAPARLKKRGFIETRGFPAKNVKQVAEAAALFRDPNIEHFQVVFERKGKVAAHQVISSGNASAVVLTNRYLQRVLSAARRLGADGIYLAHNHPSGNPKASTPDRHTTVAWAKALGDKFKGHIVTDDTEFSLIDRKGSFKLLPFNKPKESFRKPGHKLSELRDVIELARAHVKGDAVTVLLADSQLNLMEVESVRKDANVPQYVRNMIGRHKASGAFVVVPPGWDPQTSKNGKFPRDVLDIIEMAPSGKVKFRGVDLKDDIIDTGPRISDAKLEDGYYQVQDNRHIYNADQAGLVAHEFGVKPGRELTVRVAIIDATLKKGRIPKGRKVIVQGYDAENGEVLISEPASGNYTIARLEDFEETSPPPAPKPEPPSALKRRINQITGIEVPDVAIAMTEMQALKQRLKNMARGAKFGERAGARAMKAHLLEKFQQANTTRKEMQQEVKKYLENNLPIGARGNFITAIMKAETPFAVGKVFARIEAMASALYKKSLVSDIRKVVKNALNSSRVSVEAKRHLVGLMAGIDLTKRRLKTNERLLATWHYMNGEMSKGNDVEMPRAIIERLSILFRRPLESISEFELEEILKDIVSIVAMGRTVVRVRENIYKLQRERILTECIDGAAKIESDPLLLAPVGEVLPFEKRLGNVMTRVSNYMQDLDLAISPMDVVFDLMGKKRGYTGAPYKNFKARLDDRYGEYLTMLDEITEPVRQFIERKNLNKQNFERVGVHAIRVQENGVPRLLATGLTQKEIDDIQLSKDELGLYTLMREQIEKPYPYVRRLLAELYNEDILKVLHYFPFVTDWTNLNEELVSDKLFDTLNGRFGVKTKATEQGFKYNRLTGARKPVRLDAWEVFSNHLNDVVYFIAMQRDIKMLSEISKNPDFVEAVGDRGAVIVQEWLDLMARKGGEEGKRTLEAMDFLRRNYGSAQLGFRLSSIFIQPTALADGSALIGGKYVGRGTAAVLGSREWRMFLHRNMPELRHRVGDDRAFADLSDNSYLRVYQSAGYAMLKKFDAITASSVAAGAYIRAVEERGLEVDFNNPVPEALQYANLIVRRTQASAVFKDVGMALSRGKAFGGHRGFTRALLQFQTFKLGRWSLKHDLSLAIREGDKKQAAQIVTYLTLAVIAETGIRRGSKAAIYGVLAGSGFIAMAPGDRDKFSEDLVRTLIDQIPFISDGVKWWRYGFMPFPLVGGLEKSVRGSGGVVAAKDTPGKIRALNNAIEGLGAIFGVAGIGQIMDIHQKILDGKTLYFYPARELKDLEEDAKSGGLMDHDDKRLKVLRTAKKKYDGMNKRYKMAIERGDWDRAKVEVEAVKKQSEELRQ